MDRPNEGSEEPEAAAGPPFLLNPENEEYLAGGRDLPDASSGWPPKGYASLFLGFGIAGVLLILALPAVSWVRHGEFFKALLMAAAMGVFLFVLTCIIRRHLKNQQLAKREGKVLEGRVLTSGFQRRTTEDRQSDFFIWVQYVFRSPSGRALSGRNERLRNDFEHGQLPDRGARVLVFYVNDRNFQML